MRIARKIGALGFVLTMLVATGTSVVRAQSTDPSAPPSAAPSAPSDNLHIEDCASDPARLGLSRIVEIDSTGGPQFGANHGGYTDFLKDGEVVLTFDDGPLRHHTRPILKALADHCTKATFFMVGRMAASDPAMVKEVADAGHSVGTHTWSHKNLRANSFAKSEQDFEMGVSAVTRALGAPVTPFFRFPYLGDNRQIGEHLKSRNMSAWWVDVDSKDYLTRDPKVMVRRVMSTLAVRRKGIILMHDIQTSTAHGIDELLDQLHAKGFKVVHIVAKATVPSLAEYDQMVAKSFKSKSAASAANPLADRSIVWTAPTPDETAADGKAPVAPAAARPSKASVKAPTDLPWQGGSGSNPAPKSESKPKSAPPSSGEVLPWRPQTFGY